jgi:hypothetical protein
MDGMLFFIPKLLQQRQHNGLEIRHWHFFILPSFDEINMAFASQLLIMSHRAIYSQGHEYPNQPRRISARQVFSCSKYRPRAIKNQLQADPGC